MTGWCATDTGRVRQQNQDSVYTNVTGDAAVLIVCDGMGGAKAGNVASRLAVDTASGVLNAALKPGMNTKAIRQALEMAAFRANRAVSDLAKTNPDYRGMGTTFVCAVVGAKAAVAANIGDSRCYLINEGGIRRVTRDHSVVEDLKHKGTLTEKEARTHPKKNLITRALGTDFDVACDLFDIEPEHGDFLLLCSDGLTNMVDDQEILYEVIHGGPIEHCCERLVALSNLRGGSDNVTVALLSI